MSRAKWSADGEDLPDVNPHTKAKHKILEEYIENLIITLYGRGRYGVTTFTFIDAFCGGGMYRDPEGREAWEGSPIRIIKAVQRGYEKSRRQYPLNVKYIFMDSDSDKAHLDCLKNYSLPKAGLEELSISLIPKGQYRVLYYLMHMSADLTALEVIKESFWKENTLDYEYCFEVYGYGFRNADYYQEGQLELQFDINKESNEFCIEKLNRDVGKLIEESKEGIRFKDISSQTMEKNPASRKHYTQYLNRRRDASEIQVLRKGEILTDRKIIFQRDDIIQPTRFRQLIFF